MHSFPSHHKHTHRFLPLEDYCIVIICFHRSEFTPKSPLAYGTGPFNSSASIGQTGKEYCHQFGEETRVEGMWWLGIIAVAGNE